jgi:siroheme synthase-like protein
MNLLPLFLKLEQRPATVIGAGSIALAKIQSLLHSGARTRVIAPQAHPEVQQLAAAARIEWLPRAYAPGDLDGQFLVIAATSDPAVNRAVYLEAVERNVLCNSVDDPPHCDFYFGSIVERGDLQIAISTAGKSPALAQRLRREIDALLPGDTGAWLDALGTLRQEILAAYPSTEERKQVLHQLAARPLCASADCPSRQQAWSDLTSPKIEVNA